jgi:hypothetical protein
MSGSHFKAACLGGKAVCWHAESGRARKRVPGSWTPAGQARVLGANEARGDAGNWRRKPKLQPAWQGGALTMQRVARPASAANSTLLGVEDTDGKACARPDSGKTRTAKRVRGPTH